MGILSAIKGMFGGRSGRAQVVRIVHDRHPIHASYDAAQTTDYNRNHWAVADSYDADAANSKAVRSTLTKRSRYETENNGYAKGVNRTLANYEVGRGPKLRLQTKSPAFNAMVQDQWVRWCKRVKLARKLRTAVKARAKDGEAFLLAKANGNLRHPVKLDIVGIECEQCTSTDLLFAQKGRIDGIHFDDFGNPTAYDILPYHPGGQWTPIIEQAERVDAKFVFHLFQEERPNQHRAIPEAAATISTCGQSRRWREATLQAAENLADFSLFIKTKAGPNNGPGQLLPFDTLEIQKGLMTALPADGDAFQPKAEQPGATYESFLRTQVGEQVRPYSMSYSLGACDSSNANFASAKLDQHRSTSRWTLTRRMLRIWFLIRCLTCGSKRRSAFSGGRGARTTRRPTPGTGRRCPSSTRWTRQTPGKPTCVRELEAFLATWRKTDLTRRKSCRKRRPITA